MKFQLISILLIFSIMLSGCINTKPPMDDYPLIEPNDSLPKPPSLPDIDEGDKVLDSDSSNGSDSGSGSSGSGSSGSGSGSSTGSETQLTDLQPPALPDEEMGEGIFGSNTNEIEKIEEIPSPPSMPDMEVGEKFLGN